MLLAINGEAAGIVAAMDTPKENAAESYSAVKEHAAGSGYADRRQRANSTGYREAIGHRTGNRERATAGRK